ncbi:hypothetical protein ACS127_17345 [Amphibacillus sp. Q70]
MDPAEQYHLAMEYGFICKECGLEIDGCETGYPRQCNECTEKPTDGNQ